MFMFKSSVSGIHTSHCLQAHGGLFSLRRWSSSLPPPPPPLSSLRGTVQAHTAITLLHASQPPPTFPARGPVSQVSKRLQLETVKWGGIVNWVWRGPGGRSSCTTNLQAGSGTEEKGTQGGQKHPELKESYRATVFSKNGQLEIPCVGLDNVDEIAEVVHGFAVGSGEEARVREQIDEEIHLLVCTHMARDCRCGEQGGAFVQRLREEVEHANERLEGIARARIRIGEVGHIGGHIYAPNLLVYPHGDWYGLLSPSQVPQILDDLVRAAVKTPGVVRALGQTEGPLLASRGLRDHWRGRMGMSKEEQAALADKLGLGREA